MRIPLPPSVKLTLVFLLFGTCWVLFSDALAYRLIGDNASLYSAVQHYKGFLLVIIFTVFIYFICRSFYRRQEETLMRYRLLSTATRDAIWDFNLFTKECYTNQTVKELFGYPEEELKNNYTWWTNNLHPEDKERVLGSIDKAMQTGGAVWQDEYRFRCKNGEYKIIFDRGFIMRTPQGNPYRLMGAMQDVTEQRALQQRVAEDEIRHQHEMAVSILQAEEAERKKIAEELHDNINQLLGVVKLYLLHARNNPSMSEDLLAKGSEYIAQVIEEIRRLSHTLQPPALSNLSLLDCVRKVITSIQEVKQMSIELNTDEFDEDQVSENKKLMVYRIIQEQLNNVLKHSDANFVEIRLAYSNNAVYLSIRDNGVGFDTRKYTSGIGFNNIRNRIEVFNGSMQISSAPGEGCTLAVEFAV
ncbi:MAG: PAS domain-containing protein [Chitinophagaceae bacterium]